MAKIILEIDTCPHGCPWYRFEPETYGGYGTGSFWRCDKIDKRMGAYNREGGVGPLEVPSWCPIREENLTSKDWRDF